MKTIKHFLLTLAMLLCSISASAHDFEVNGVYYNITSEEDLTVEVTWGDISEWDAAYSGSVTIPESVVYNATTYSVTKIGEYAFYNQPNLTSLAIGNNVGSISENAFYGNPNLAEVHISDIAAWCNIEFEGGITSNPLYFAERLFLGEEEIKHMVIPEGVTAIKNGAFMYCKSLTSITIPNSVTSIGESAFSVCTSLTEVNIGNSVTSIGESAFYNCRSLKNIEIPNSVENLGIGTFSDCSDLKSVSIGDGIISIEAETFNACYNLTDVTIGNSVKNIKESAFCNCISLITVDIPNSVTSIWGCAFFGCYNLASVTIPNSVTFIGYQTFYGCYGLNDVYCLAASVPETYYDAFENTDIGNATLHVPAGSVEAYAAAEPWSGFGEIVALPAEEVEITIGSTGATTFCSEYALDFTDAEGVKAYAATGYNTETGVVTLTRVKTAKAGTGLFVVGDEGTYSIPTIDASADNSLNMLVGTTEEVTIPAVDGTYTNYIYGKSDDNTGFFKLTGDKVIPAGKAYLRIPTEWFPAVAESKIKIEFEDGTTTGIDDVEEQVRPNDGVIYDLHGRVVKNPGKGIYIVNGKKVLF